MSNCKSVTNFLLLTIICCKAQDKGGQAGHQLGYGIYKT
uniref:Uncharacterized protein n=1 Tax=Arundo donax TaxID=35708 RepID=A0A0A8XX60_ARUDO